MTDAARPGFLITTRGADPSFFETWMNAHSTVSCDLASDADMSAVAVLNEKGAVVWSGSADEWAVIDEQWGSDSLARYPESLGDKIRKLRPKPKIPAATADLIKAAVRGQRLSHRQHLLASVPDPLMAEASKEHKVSVLMTPATKGKHRWTSQKSLK